MKEKKFSDILSKSSNPIFIIGQGAMCAEDAESIFNFSLMIYNKHFKNKTKDLCPNISFLEVEIVGKTKPYKNYLENYFKSLKINKNKFDFFL